MENKTQNPKNNDKVMQNDVQLSKEDDKQTPKLNVTEQPKKEKVEKAKKESIKKVTKKVKTLEVMPAPTDGRITKRKSYEPADNSDLPDHPLSVREFRGQIVLLDPIQVIPYFKKLYKNELLISAKATVLELKRLGYSTELSEHKISLQN